MKQAFKPKNNTMFNYAKYSSLAFQTIVIICCFVFLGVKLDQWSLNKTPIYALLFSIIGISLSLYLLIKDTLKKPSDD